MPKLTTTTRKPVAKRTPKKKVEATFEHIATRAYFIHLEEGGDPQSNWLRAERELVPS